jgi:hypothetical protein
LTIDKQVFKGFFRNNYFISILIITVVCQAIIVQFAGVVFRIDPAGLSLANWGISIAIGSGALIVGFLLRLLPDPQNIPVWMLGGSTVIDAKEPLAPTPGTLDKGQSVEPLIVAVPPMDSADSQPDSIEPNATVETPASKRWNNAIEKTRTQLRVVHVFRLPSDVAKPSPRPSSNRGQSKAKLELEPVPKTFWGRLRMYVLIIMQFRRHRRDPASTLMIDPRRIRQAQADMARSRNT